MIRIFPLSLSIYIYIYMLDSMRLNSSRKVIKLVYWNEILVELVAYYACIFKVANYTFSYLYICMHINVGIIC